MANCNTIQKQLSDYLEQNLSESAKQSVDDHLSVCASCKSKAEGIQSITYNLSNLPKQKASDEFDIVLRAKIRDYNRNRGFTFKLPRLSPVWRVPAYATMVFVLMGLGAFLDRAFNTYETSLDTNNMATSVVPSATQDVEEYRFVPTDTTTALRVKRYVNVGNNYPGSRNGNSTMTTEENRYLEQRSDQRRSRQPARRRSNISITQANHSQAIF